MTVEQMRAECIRHYVGRRHSPEHAEIIIPKDEKEVRRIYACIQEEEEQGTFESPNPFSNLTDEETAAE